MLRLGGGIYYLFYLKTEKHILYIGNIVITPSKILTQL